MGDNEVESFEEFDNFVNNGWQFGLFYLFLACFELAK